MTLKRMWFVVLVSLVTAISLAGSIAFPFFLIDDVLRPIVNPHYSEGVYLVIGLTIIIGSLLVGGAAWGWGLGWVTQAGTAGLVRTGASTWSVNVFLAGFVLYFSQLLGPPLERTVSLSVHTMFTIVFVLATGLTVASVTYWMGSKLGLGDVRKTLARNAGFAAMLGFLATSLILLHVFEWEVGGRYAGWKYNMIDIMHICNATSALFGGAVMAWYLFQAQQDIVTQDQMGLSLEMQDN